MIQLLLAIFFVLLSAWIIWKHMTVENKTAVKQAVKQGAKDAADVNDDGKVNVEDVKAAAKKVTRRGRPKKGDAKKTSTE